MFSFFSLLGISILILSESDQIINMDKIAPQTEFFWDYGFGLASFQEETVKNKKVLLVVHGYNTTFEGALQHTTRIHTKVSLMKTETNQPLYDLIIGYVWPGTTSFFGFELASHHVNVLKTRLRQHLIELREATPTIDVCAHSLGNRLVLEALNFVPSPQQIPLIQHFYALAPAVDAASIKKNKSLAQGVANCKQLYIFHSDKDHIINVLYPLASGEDSVGVDVKDTLKKVASNVQFVDCSKIIGKHGSYLSKEAIFKFIQKSALDQTPPAEEAPRISLQKDGSIKIKK